MPKAPPSTATAVEAPASYEAALAELQRIVEALESGSMPLEQMLSSYQRGAELLNFCRGKLQAVEEQVRLIDGSVFKPKRAGTV
ncbi:exodeoxyribonuclease VII small subunit [Curvibacter sp. APW13]|uniref:exodeoxyribonuclease VII small subunit n=1 Tax=Curvibacter sp. APW13 TaxID=3077236 RepID=UPI0028DE9D46|nr:exodeoxyribonuclease VII small subunit [Curvibacter sp. APW13]MDT8989302.1 exodeoxyribonuclease VII small subunit [Curvibacter sp. APW13]